MSRKEYRTLTEGVDMPTMICWGRGYGENSNPMDMSVVDRFNSLVERNDPYTGQINPVMSMVNRFSANNASKYSVDPDPELDKYVDTLIIGDMGPEAFTVNGQNPYRLLEKIQAGEEVDLGPINHGVGIRPQQPAIVPNEETQVDPGFTETFDDIFNLGV